jgi:hypothetical protein
MSQVREGDWRWRLRTVREIKAAALRRWLVKLGSVGVLCAVLALGTITIGAQPEADAPFLYYYSAEQGAFIVERADGTEREILAQVEVAGDKVVGPGWSPSGRWLAWTVTSSTSPEALALVLDRTTETVSNVLSIQGDVLALDWSPTEDLLLIQYVEDNTNGYAQYTIIDVTDQSSLLKFDATTLAQAGNLPLNQQVAMQWTPSGNYIALYYPLPSSENSHLYNMRVYSSDGQETVSREITLNYVGSSLPTQCLPQWSKEDTVAYIDLSGETLNIEEITTGKLSSLAITMNTTGVFDWNISSNQAFVYRNAFCAEQDNGELAFLDLAEAAFRSLLPSVQRPIPYPSYLSQSLFEPSIVSVWSPNAEHGVFVDQNTNIFVFSMSTGEIISISLPVETSQVIARTVSWIDADQFRFVAQDESHADWYVLKHGISSRSTEIEAAFSATGDNFVFSNPPTHLAFSSSDCRGACVIDLIDDQQYTIVDEWSPQTYDGVPSFFELFLHPSKPWLFLTGQQYSGEYRSLYVADFTGEFVREIGTINMSASSFGWLPDEHELDGSD